tara:strand:- start:232 stop:507 length:276 start_codon:yes stop_codon:yes gene_type:complete
VVVVELVIALHLKLEDQAVVELVLDLMHLVEQVEQVILLPLVLLKDNLVVMAVVQEVIILALVAVELVVPQLIDRVVINLVVMVEQEFKLI